MWLIPPPTSSALQGPEWRRRRFRSAGPVSASVCARRSPQARRGAGHLRSPPRSALKPPWGRHGPVCAAPSPGPAAAWGGVGAALSPFQLQVQADLGSVTPESTKGLFQSHSPPLQAHSPEVITVNSFAYILSDLFLCIYKYI